MTKLNDANNMTLAEAKKIIKTLPKYLKPVGSVLSRQPNPQDLDFLTLKPLASIKRFLEKKYPKVWMKTRGKIKRLDYFPIINGKNIVMNYWYTTKEDLPFFKLAYGYPRGISIHLKKVAKDKGFKLSQYGLFNRHDVKMPIKTIRGIFEFLGVKYRTPAQDYLKHHKK
jgi:hypothetical protein